MNHSFRRFRRNIGQHGFNWIPAKFAAIGRISITWVAVVIVLVSGMGMGYLIISHGVSSATTASTSGLCCPPVFGVFEPNWHNLPTYNVSSNSLPQTLQGRFSINVSEPYQIVFSLLGTVPTSHFTVNITIVENNENQTYILGPNMKISPIPTVKGTMWFVYTIAVHSDTPAGRYEADIQINPVKAPSNYVGTQFPIVIFVE